MRHRMLFVVGWLLLCLTVPTLAQLSEDETTFTFNNGLVLTIPDGWKPADQDNDQKDFIALDDGRTGLTLRLYYPQTLKDANIDTPAGVLEGYYSSVFKMEIDTRDAEDTTVEGYDGVRYFGTVTSDKDEYEQATYAFLLPDGSALLGAIYPMKGTGLRSTSEQDALPLIEDVLKGAGELPSGGDKPDIVIPTPDIGSSGDNSGQNTDSQPESDGSSVDFGYMTTLTVPEGWTLEESGGAFARITDDTTKIEFSFYTPHRAGLKGRSPEDLLLDYFKTVNNAEDNKVDSNDVESTTLGGLEAARYETKYRPDAETEYELTVVSVILPNQAGIVAAIYPAKSDRLESQFRALSVVEDFVAAQPAAVDTIDLGYNVQFDLPRGWAIYELQDNYVSLTNGSVLMRLKTYYPATVDSSRLTTADDVLSYYMENAYPDVAFRSRDAETIEVDRLEGAFFRYDAESDDGTYPRVVAAVLLDDEKRAIVTDFNAIQGSRIVGEDEVFKLFGDIVGAIEDMPKKFEFVDGSVLTLPKGWHYYTSKGTYLVNMDDNVTGIIFDMYTPDEISGNASTPEELLTWYKGEDIPGSKLDNTTLADIDGVRYENSYQDDAGNTYDRVQFAFMLPNDYGLVVTVYSAFTDPFNEKDALPVIESFLEEKR